MLGLVTKAGAGPREPLSARIGRGIDAIIGIMSPARGARRAAYRRALEITARHYHRGADFDRSKGWWNVGNVPADTANLAENPTLRGRAHDLLRNNAIASGLAETFVVNEVGMGIRPQSRIDHETIGITLEQAQATQRIIERAWADWSRNVTIDNRLGMWGLQELVSRLEFSSGEAYLIRRYRKRKGSNYSICWQIIEPERVCTPFNKNVMTEAGTNEVRDGVELDANGEPIAYWVANASPLAGAGYIRATEFQRIPAWGKDGRRNVIHFYHQKRPEQSHGTPALGPVIEIFDHLSGYLESEWVRARVAACFAAFIKSDENSPQASANANSTLNSVSNLREEKIRPGVIQYLRVGEEVQFANPNLPGAGFEPFVMKALQFIGAAFGLPLELVIKDFSKTNYSSARAALLEARRVFRSGQQRLICCVCQIIWECFIDELVLRGEIPVRDYEKYRHAYTCAAWIAPGWEWVDPEKEIKAKVLAIDNNLSTLSDEFADQGKDWEAQLRQRALEKELVDELGLTPVPAAPAANQQMNDGSNGNDGNNQNQ